MNAEANKFQKKIQDLESAIAIFKDKYSDSLPELLEYNLSAVERLQSELVSNQNQISLSKDQIMTLKSLGGKTMKPIDLEWALVQKDVITDSELQDDPRSEQSQMEKRLAEEEDNNGNRYSPSKGGHRNIRRSDRFWDDSDEEDDNV